MVYDKKYSIQDREAILGELRPTTDFNGVFIHTCNRLELYRGGGRVSKDTARHLFRVTSGLESTFLGDIAVQSQVKQAYCEAARSHKLDGNLHKLFQKALNVGKRVRTETSISAGAMSYSQASVDIINELNFNTTKANITILGVHNMSKDIVKFLTKKGASTIFIGNRTYDKAKELATSHGCEAFKFSHLPTRLLQTDILITATSAPHYVIKPETFPKNKEMLIIDLAMPRDVHPDISTYKKVKVLNVEEIESLVQTNRQQRVLQKAKAEAIVEEEVVTFISEMERRAQFIKRN